MEVWGLGVLLVMLCFPCHTNHIFSSNSPPVLEERSALHLPQCTCSPWHGATFRVWWSWEESAYTGTTPRLSSDMKQKKSRKWDTFRSLMSLFITLFHMKKSCLLIIHSFLRSVWQSSFISAVQYPVGFDLNPNLLTDLNQLIEFWLWVWRSRSDSGLVWDLKIDINKHKVHIKTCLF